MKWITLFALLAPNLILAQMVVHDAPNYQAATEQLRKAEKTISQLEEQIDWMRLQGEMQAEMFFFQDSLAVEKLNTERLMGLRMAEQKDLYDQVRSLSVSPQAYGGAEGLSELSGLLSGSNPQNVEVLHDFLFPSQDLVLDAEEDLEMRAAQMGKQRAMEELIRKQRLHLALVNYNLAQTEAIKAEELRRYLMDNDKLSMSEGERIVALQAVNSNLLRTIVLRQDAAELIQLALRPSAREQAQHELQSARLQLHSTRLRFEELIPGYNRK